MSTGNRRLKTHAKTPFKMAVTNLEGPRNPMWIWWQPQSLPAPQTNMGIDTHACAHTHPAYGSRFATSQAHLWTVVHAPEL